MGQIMSRAFAAAMTFSVFALAPAPVGAAVIYTTFGPGDSYDNSLHNIGYLSDFESDLQVAVPFLASFDSSLDSIRVATNNYTGPNDLNDFTVYLASDAPDCCGPGAPGAILETFSGLTFTPDAPSILTLNSVLHPVLSADPNVFYWLVMKKTFSDGVYTGGWNFNDQSLFGHGFYYSDGGTNWNVEPDLTGQVPAFDLNGTRITDVPEPGTMALMAAGLLMYGLLRSRRKSKFV